MDNTLENITISPKMGDIVIIKEYLIGLRTTVTALQTQVTALETQITALQTHSM